MSVTDVWGIGSRLGKRLNVLGINNAWQLAKQDSKSMRKQFSVVVERTINELNGITCLNWDDIRQPKKEIFSTRSFGQRVTDHNALKAALTSHASIVGRKVRHQQSLIKRLLIFASSSPHDENYYKKSLIYEFTVATDNTCKIAAGVGAIELVDSKFQQHDLFINDDNNPNLMKCYDRINNRYGNGLIEVAAVGQTEKWAMKRNFLSPSFTSKWQDIPKIQC